MQRVKAHDLRKKDEKVILEELTKQRKELAQLRVSKVSSQPQVKLSKIKVSRGRPVLLSCLNIVHQEGHR